MAQTANTIPPHGLNKIQLSDFWKGLFIAALSNIFLSLYAIINTGAWPTHADLMVMLKATIAIVLSYIIKNFKTNNVGELFTQDKPVTTVPTEKLNNLKEKAAQADEIPTLKINK